MKSLTVTDLHFSYQEKSILAKMDFSLPAGQLIGIVGPNGSGKSTLLKLLARQLTPASGEIRLHQRPLGQYGHKELARTLAYLPQRPHLPAGIRVEQLVRYGRYPHQSWLQQWSEEDNRLVQEAREQMQLDAIWQQPAASLSGGQAQRVWLAMILAQNSPLILLDEPTSALDIGHQADVLEAIHRMTQTGKTVVMVIHDLAAAGRYCDQLLALAEGTLKAMGPVHEVIQAPLIEQLYGTPVDILQAPGDGSPIIVPRRSVAYSHERLLQDIHRR